MHRPIMIEAEIAIKPYPSLALCYSAVSRNRNSLHGSAIRWL